MTLRHPWSRAGASEKAKKKKKKAVPCGADTRCASGKVPLNRHLWNRSGANGKTKKRELHCVGPSRLVEK